jgi:S-sulfo-L-cysteine synthase (3-phospho-L-serine-dependent)
VVGSWVAAQCQGDQDVVVIMPDRGDRYSESIYSRRFLAEKGLAGVTAAAAPLSISYRTEVAERWSRAALPVEGATPYYDPLARRTVSIEAEMAAAISA